MAELRNYQTRPIGAQADAAIDQGLRAYMLRVYNLMAIALVVTGVGRLDDVARMTIRQGGQDVGQRQDADCDWRDALSAPAQMGRHACAARQLCSSGFRVDR